MSFNNYLEDKTLNYIFHGVTFAPPFFYVALFIGDPGEAGSGGTEVSGGAYARIQSAPSDWSAVSLGSILNATEFAFVEATTDWGDITHFALFDMSTGGNMLMYGAITTAPVTISLGSIPRFAVGTIVVTLN
ncbi:hypothetical protein LCGC14_0849480 [marine sediment metagenome]|uniref:Uncharacterized protein n=1 Tax=marine sediment metagenome TaxID=412755 RepID=A0A0F9PAQ8_9ZZZZ